MQIKDIAIINPNSKIRYKNFINYIDTSSVLDGKLLNIQKLYPNYPSRAQRILEKNDILISSVRPNLLHNYFINKNIEYGVASSGFLQIRTLSEKTNPRFLYYFLTSSKNVSKYSAIAESSQTTIPTFNKDIIENLEIPNYSYDQQLLIVDTVGSIDDKIENNNKLIEKLIKWKENDYQIKVSNIPCKEYELLEIISFIGGTQPPKSEHIYNPKEGYIRFIQNRDYSSENHLTYIKESSKNKLCDEYDIMMDKYGEAGKVRFGIKGAYNVALAKILPKNINQQEWIREFLNTPEIEQYLFNSSIASTRASVSENNLLNIKIKIPSNDVLIKFENQHKLIINMILKVKKENQKLCELKELYLKKFF